MPARTKYTHGSATPLPQSRYSALSVCGCFSHFTICRSVFGFVFFPSALRYVSKTSRQNATSSAVGSSVPRSLHQPSGKPCRRAHSVGVSFRTI